MNIANVLTCFRLAAVPFIVALAVFNYPIYAVLLFIIAAATDIIDGPIARKQKKVSLFGSFLDPITDKILINCLFITLLYLGVLPLWTVLLMISREFAVQVIRDAAKAKDIILKSETSGKIKADAQGITILIGLLTLANLVPIVYTHIAMYITLAISYYALVEFLLKNKEWKK
ncbi:MAG: CDP-diacylglycerol--glycerol-3-phosphate 3-phosphatidyltransferase [Candidatus Aenigmarchaeota archaeon]|nr:CDP-diacylglycerol--glycerol-3-phosphate 3-phosphatidyltransferase [Candidatus Aenigmarchaeota archaeon]